MDRILADDCCLSEDLDPTIAKILVCTKSSYVEIAKLANQSWKHLSNTEISAFKLTDRKLYTMYRLVTASN